MMKVVAGCQQANRLYKYAAELLLLTDLAPVERVDAAGRAVVDQCGFGPARERKRPRSRSISGIRFIPRRRQTVALALTCVWQCTSQRPAWGWWPRPRGSGRRPRRCWPAWCAGFPYRPDTGQHRIRTPDTPTDSSAEPHRTTNYWKVFANWICEYGPAHMSGEPHSWTR